MVRHVARGDKVPPLYNGPIWKLMVSVCGMRSLSDQLGCGVTPEGAIKRAVNSANSYCTVGLRNETRRIFLTAVVRHVSVDILADFQAAVGANNRNFSPTSYTSCR